MTRSEIEKAADEFWPPKQGTSTPIIDFCIQQVNAALEEAALLFWTELDESRAAKIRNLKIKD